MRLLVIGQRQRRTREKGEPTGKSCFGTMFGAPIWVITAPSIGDEHRTTVGHAGVGVQMFHAPAVCSTLSQLSDGLEETVDGLRSLPQRWRPFRPSRWRVMGVRFLHSRPHPQVSRAVVASNIG